MTILGNEKHKILIIDDDALIVRMLSRFLTKKNYNVVYANSGKLGLRKIKMYKDEIDCVLLDAIMPEIDGFEVCKNIKKHFSDIPVLMITASENKKTIADVFDAGADDYIQKNENWELLLERKLQVFIKTKILQSKLMQHTNDLEELVGEKTIELTNALIQAQEANMAKSKFLSIVSHEFRTPMNAIIGLTDLLSYTALNEEQKDYVKTVQKSSDSLLHILNDILDTSKIESNKMSFETKLVDISKLIDKIIKSFKGQIESKSLELTVVKTDLPKTIKTDPSRLKQILINLLSNSIKFTQKGGIELSASFFTDGKNNILSIAVEDTGIGISKESLGKIFNPFIQADMSATRKFGGSGLGLSLSRDLAYLLEGDLSVNSVKGKGSVFILTVPIEIEAETNIEKQEFERKTPIESYKILLAEDSVVVQKVAKAMLEKLGHNIAIAHNGLEAVEKADKTNFDLIFMDCQMPTMDGFEATKQIRCFDKDVPIVALTASTQETDKKKAIDSGMNDFISKPIVKNILLKTIEKII